MERHAPAARFSVRLGASIVATVLYLLVTAGGAPAELGVPTRVADINPGAPGSSVVSTAIFGRHVIFRGFNPIAGDEPIISDGTAAGTISLEVAPGPAAHSIPGDFTPIGDEVVFLATGVGGDELWRTDMTQAGTSRVLDINPGPASSFPRGFTSVGDAAIFSANDGTTGTEPWRTDGTAAGTSRVADISPGLPGAAAASYFPDRLGDHLLFQASEPVAGPELWRVPVAGSGADLVANINLGGGSAPRELEPLANSMLFTADDGIVGRELWVSDGQPGGDTDLVDNFDGAATDSGVTFLTTMGDHVYFQVDGDGNGVELWRSDGTPGGAEIVHDMNPAGDSNPEDVTAIGPWLYFTATQPATGREVWRTNGVPGGTTEMVADIDPGGSGPCPDPEFTEVGGIVYFCADDGSTGNELWRTDGTEAGTTRAADINPGAVGSNPDDLVAQDDQVIYFSANDGSTGDELWAVDVEAPGTEVLEGPGAGEHISDSRPQLRISSRAVDLARYECSSGGPYEICADRGGVGQTAALADGEQTLSVRAVDVRENPDQTPDELRFTVDTRAPKISIRGKRVALDARGAIRLKAKCKRSELSGPCRGKVVLKTTKGKAKVAKKKFKLKPGKAKRLKLKVKPTKLGLLDGRSAVRAEGKVRDRLGNKRTFRSKKLRVSGP